MRRLNSTIDSKNLAQIQDVLEPYGIKVSEALRIGLNLLSAALPALADGGSIVFTSPKGERAYSIPVSEELGQSWLPTTDKHLAGTKRLTGSLPDSSFILIKKTLERHGLTISEGMRKGLNLFAAAMPTLSQPGGAIVLRSSQGGEQVLLFPFLANSSPHPDVAIGSDASSSQLSPAEAPLLESGVFPEHRYPRK